MKPLFPPLILILTLPVILARLPVAAQIGDLAQIKEDRRLLTALEDSMLSARVRLLARTDSIDRHVDSLRAYDPESGELLKARIDSRQLVLRLGFIDMALDTLRARTDSLDEALRDAYDWQISQLLGMLTDEFDEGLYHQLRLYQDEREELGSQILRGQAGLHDDDGRLSLSEDDGPMELTQKIQLAQDQVAHYQQERHRIADRLRRLERDALLAGEMWHVHEQFMSLRQRNQRLLRELVPPAVEANVQAVASADDLLLRLSTATDGDEDQTAPPVRSILLQITKLKARQQELQQLEAIWQERLAGFHARLTQILESSAPTLE